MGNFPVTHWLQAGWRTHFNRLWVLVRNEESSICYIRSSCFIARGHISSLAEDAASTSASHVKRQVVVVLEVLLHRSWCHATVTPRHKQTCVPCKTKGISTDHDIRPSFKHSICRCQWSLNVRIQRKIILQNVLWIKCNIGRIRILLLTSPSQICRYTNFLSHV